MTSLPHCGSAGGDAVRRLLEAIGSLGKDLSFTREVYKGREFVKAI